MRKWFYLFLLIVVGCSSYIQPKNGEAYGVVHPTGVLRITNIDGIRTTDLSGDYIFRVAPGRHTLTIARGHNKTPVEGKRTHLANFVLEIKEGTRYYLKASLSYGLNSLFFGVGFKEVKSWKPEVLRQEPISSYWKSHEKKDPESQKPKKPQSRVSSSSESQKGKTDSP